MCALFYTFAFIKYPVDLDRYFFTSFHCTFFLFAGMTPWWHWFMSFQIEENWQGISRNFRALWRMLAGGALPDTDMTSLTVLSPSRVEILNVHLVSNRRQLTGMSCCFNFCHTNMCHLSHDTVVHSTKSIFFVCLNFVKSDDVGH